MIWESCYWKEPLLKDRKYLLSFRRNESTSEKTLAGLEKRIFLSFYSIRKLIEADKLSTKNVDSKWSIYSYYNKSRVDKMNWHKIDVKYDFTNRQKERRNLRWICNQVIHSYVFILGFDEKGKISCFYISSDREKNIKLYEVSRQEMLDIFKTIGSDYPSASHGYRGKDGEWITKQW